MYLDTDIIQLNSVSYVLIKNKLIIFFAKKIQHFIILSKYIKYKAIS
jgi:hypothetical protein